MRTNSAQPSASGPSTSHRNSGTPSSLRKLIALGTVHTRASPRVASSATAACTFIARTAGDTLTVGARGLPVGGPGGGRCGWLGVGAVADLAHQLLDHVLQGGHAQRGTVAVDDPCHVGTSALELLEGLVEQVVGADGREGPDPLVLDRLLAARHVGLEYVLDVQVAHQLAVAAHHGEPAVAGGGAQSLHVGAGRATAYGLQ